MNSITLAKKFIPLLDETYRLASVTSVLDGNAELVRQGANWGELVIPIMSLQGLADYDRNSGYVQGDVTLTYETVTCNFDRGRMFNVDATENLDSAGSAFAFMAGEFIRNEVGPELDAFRLASYASKTGVSSATGTLTSGADAVSAIRAAVTKMDENEVSPENRYLFITPTIHGMIQDMDTTKSREVLSRFAGVIDVPQSRFYTQIALKCGKIVTNVTDQTTTTDDQTDGGFVKGPSGKDINFMVIHKPAVIQFQKHVSSKIITPDMNPTADAYKLGYHNVGIADVYKNKLAGVYVHHKA